MAQPYELINRVQFKRPKEWRYGQALFNYFYEDPEYKNWMDDFVIGRNIDPFYTNDEKVIQNFIQEAQIFTIIIYEFK